MTKPFHLLLSLLLIGILVYGIWDIQFSSKPCDPQAAHAQLKTFSEKGIRNTGHGSSLSNLLWIYVDQKWFDKLQKKDDAEQDMLDMAFEPKKNSRLACQITATDELDGLVVKMPSKQA